MNVWHELRRRQMFRLVGLYIVGAWLVIQVADIVFPAWGIPDSAMRYLFLAAFLCFPIALVFGWIFDIRKDGIYRTRKAGPDEIVENTLQRPDYVILIALLAVGMAVLLGSADMIHEEIAATPADAAVVERREHSIAVLPFVNLDTNPDTGYFSDGVTEEILNRLSSLRVLHVLGRTSSFAFRNSDDGPARIAEILGVRYLLHGSVRRENNYVRVTARLLDESGYQVWGSSYDRKLESIFVIQSEIASSVSNQILNEIVPLSEQTAGRTTANMDAFNEYLVGKAVLHARTPGWPEQAAAAFQRAIDRDANFAPPYAGLAFALAFSEDKKDEAWHAAERSIELDPMLAEGHLSIGLLFGWQQDYPKATESLRYAIELDPTLAIAYNLIGNVLGFQGRDAEIADWHDKGLEVDPLNPVLTVNIAHRYRRLGDPDRAEQLMLRLTYLPETPGFVYRHLQILYYDLGRMHEVLKWWNNGISAHTKHWNSYNHREKEYYLVNVLEAFLTLGMAEDAAFWGEYLVQIQPDDRERFVARADVLLASGKIAKLQAHLDDCSRLTEQDALELGELCIIAGNFEAGIELLEPLLDFESLQTESPSNTLFVLDAVYALAHAYKQVGRTDAARDLLLESQDIIEALASSGKFVLPQTFASLALNRAMRGDESGALQALEKAVDLGWVQYNWIIASPLWTGVIESSGFQKLLARVKTEIDRQREIVEAANADHDFGAEVEKLLSR